jgi:macrodomain Ter protein organizer (MatP/YcbG family)
LEKKKTTRLELKVWKRLKNLATEKESNVEQEVNEILKTELEINGEDIE